MEIVFILAIIIIIAIMFLSISRQKKLIDKKNENTDKSVSNENHGNNVFPAYSNDYSLIENGSVGDLLDEDFLDEIMEESMNGSFSDNDDNF
jgi:hypothetical protein